jgi:hypothetical protein
MAQPLVLNQPSWMDLPQQLLQRLQQLLQRKLTWQCHAVVC